MGLGAREAMGVMERLVRYQQAAELEQIKADPQANKLTKLFAELRYRYFSAGKDGRGRRITFCWSTTQNEAGYYLGWREVVDLKRGTAKRDRFTASKSRTRVKEQALARSRKQAATRRGSTE